MGRHEAEIEAKKAVQRFAESLAQTLLADADRLETGHELTGGGKPLSYGVAVAAVAAGMRNTARAVAVAANLKAPYEERGAPAPVVDASSLCGVNGCTRMAGHPGATHERNPPLSVRLSDTRATGDAGKRIIVVEGPDGAGKTSLVEAMTKVLYQSGVKRSVLRLPGGTPLGELLRGPLKDPGFELTPLEKALLFVAVDSAGQREAMKLAVAGEVVLLDRCALSNLVYRAAQDEHEALEVVSGLLPRVGGLWPHGAHVVMLDAADEVLKARVKARREADGKPDRFDGLGEKVTRLYRRAAVDYGLRVVRTDGADPTALAFGLLTEFGLVGG